MDVQNLTRYNKGCKYLQTCVDIFSKYAWVVPLKTKQGQELAKAFQTILVSGRKPSKLQTDQGTNFLNRVFQKFLRENNIEFFFFFFYPQVWAQSVIGGAFQPYLQEQDVQVLHS